jgi:hypothetical protein
MKTRIAIALGLLLGALTGLRGQAATAPLFPSHPTCFELAVVANRFIALGEEGTVAALTRQWNSARQDMTLEDSTREQIGWVCRLIFSQKAKAVLRRPRFGAYGCLFRWKTRIGHFTHWLKRWNFLRYGRSCWFGRSGGGSDCVSRLL